MILAAILRNFKCYKGINIIPFNNGSLDCMNIIIGNNGVGKSAVLEGLNTLFNDSQWIIHNEVSSKKDVSVGAIMLVEKNKLENVLSETEKHNLLDISNFFWAVDDSNSTLRQYYTTFFTIRGRLIDFKNDNYFFVVGKEHENKELSFLSFTTPLRLALPDARPTNQTFSKLLCKILSLYTYIYIPVETSISDFVKLQNQSFQTLMDSSIKNNIVEELTNKRIKREVGRVQKRLSLLDIINESLEKYVNDVEKDIQAVNQEYSYQPARRQSSKLTSYHVVDTIIAAYYSRRSFKKDGKEIQYLSSGEKRIILIDIISAFIKKDNPSHELIIAVDEPENSLHISNCYDQFSKIEDIAIKYKHQLFITTHWYGSLPCLSKGNLIYIDEDGNNNVYNIDNYYEDRGELPDDIQLKGFFDLSSSLLYAFRNSGKNWLLVEGYEDKKYINYYLQDENIKIIPLGGCGNVKKIYEYLFTPLSSKEFRSCQNKIVCLIDTDAICPPINVKSGEDKDILLIRRINEGIDKTIKLLKIEDPTRIETEIEEILEPRQFFESLQDAIDRINDPEIKEAFSTFVFDDTALHSRIKGDNSILKVARADKNTKEDKQKIISFVNSHKDIISEIYISKPKTSISLDWIEHLKELIYN